ncbi:MAG TPA: hypothetical protein VI111_08450 [Thermoleophilaceae bacterium]
MLALSLCAGMLVGVGAASANVYRVTRGSISPAGGGSAAKPQPVGIGFGLGVSADDRSERPSPVKTYRIATEGVLAFPRTFPSCSLSKAKIRRAPAKACAKALIGNGLIRAAAGFDDDTTIAQSLPCNLRLRLYNTGSGLALRVDTDTPVPRSFKSRELGCPVPIHTAIRGQFTRTTLDGMVAMDLSFTLPTLLLRPLQDWEGALQLVDASLGRWTGTALIKGHRRTVGYFSSVGCHGKTRTIRAAFVDEDGNRSEATRTVVC